MTSQRGDPCHLGEAGRPSLRIVACDGVRRLTRRDQIPATRPMTPRVKEAALAAPSTSHGDKGGMRPKQPPDPILLRQGAAHKSPK
jgi:hypothetical protein